jgi:phosphotransferase system HPr (HPr) family protein
LSDQVAEAVGEVAVTTKEGLHARPVMRFVDVASTFGSTIRVCNVTLGGETLDGKSAMEMMLLEATQHCVIRITARGDDAQEAVTALTALVESGLDTPGDSPTAAVS